MLRLNPGYTEQQAILKRLKKSLASEWHYPANVQQSLGPRAACFVQRFTYKLIPILRSPN